MNRIQKQLSRRSITMALIAGLVIAGAAWGFDRISTKETEVKNFKLAIDETPIPRGNGVCTSFAPIVKKVAPAVVTIVTTSGGENTTTQDLPGFDNPFFRHFFGGNMPQSQSKTPLEHALGSGVIITKDGYILTNNHVIDGAKEVKVTLKDGRDFTAKVVGHDSKSDLAVIKIDANNLPTIPIADSSKVQVGDIVLAIGNPFGVGETVTQGIVSALNRGNMGLGQYEDFIQTDAPINPGNSGGALVDTEGRLIGINTAILSRSGGNQGIGFAIPSDLARNVMVSLVEYGHVTRGYLGGMIQNLTPALAKQFNVKGTSGVLVGDVVSKGPADKAGIKDGDVITEFNGQKVMNPNELQLSVSETKPGTTVPVKILRDGSPKTLEVTLQALPGSKEMASNNEPAQTERGALQGVGVSDLTPQTRQELKIPANVQGALVSEVQPDSSAAEAGLKQGDVIEQINKHPVKDAADALKLTQNAKDKTTLLLVWGKEGTHYLVVNESNVG